MRNKLSLHSDVVAAGGRLHEARTRLGLSRVHLGMQTGISAQQIGKYERGVNVLTIHALQRICGALNINPCEICGCSNERR